MNLRNWKKHLAPCFIFFIGAPTSIFLHEFAHYYTAKAFGCEAQLHAMRVTFTGTFENQEQADFANLIITIAGPSVQLVSLLIGAIVLNFFVLKFNKENKLADNLFWLASFLAFSGLRWLGTLPRGNRSDEGSISMLLGYDWYVLPIILFCVSLLDIWFLYWVHKKRNLLNTLYFTIPSGVIGALLWAYWVGPAIIGK